MRQTLDFVFDPTEWESRATAESVASAIDRHRDHDVSTSTIEGNLVEMQCLDCGVTIFSSAFRVGGKIHKYLGKRL